MIDENSDEITLKIIILGSSQVGKTSILNRYFNNDFKGNMLSTIGIDFKTKYIKYEDQKIKFNYIDTAGQEKFRAISSNYLKGTNGALLVFDITQKDTFDLINYWIDIIKENNGSNIAKVLFGNKSDLSDSREVPKEDAESMANELNCLYIEGSAKTGEKVQEALDELSRMSFNYYKELKESEKRRSVRLTSKEEVSDSSSENTKNNSNKKNKKKKRCEFKC